MDLVVYGFWIVLIACDILLTSFFKWVVVVCIMWDNIQWRPVPKSRRIGTIIRSDSPNNFKMPRRNKNDSKVRKFGGVRVETKYFLNPICLLEYGYLCKTSRDFCISLWDRTKNGFIISNSCTEQKYTKTGEVGLKNVWRIVVGAYIAWEQKFARFSK